jgi:hypothetical protein
MENEEFIPTENFRSLSKDLHAIRVSVVLSPFEKAREMKRFIEMFLKSEKTSDVERAKVRELLLKLNESEAKKNLDASVKRSMQRN